MKPSASLMLLSKCWKMNDECVRGCLAYSVKLIEWLMNKAKTVALVVVLSGLATVGCTTKTAIIKPECDVPQLAPLPVVMSQDMAALPDDVYWALMDRERLLTDWALEMEATLEVICKKNPD